MYAPRTDLVPAPVNVNTTRETGRAAKAHQSTRVRIRLSGRRYSCQVLIWRRHSLSRASFFKAARRKKPEISF